MTRLTFLLLFLFSLQIALSQSSCLTASSVCFPNTTVSAETSVPMTPLEYSGCLFSTPNPSWLFLSIASSGSLHVQIASDNDVDFLCWGPFSSALNCSSLNDSAQVPNSPGLYASSTNTSQGCSYSGSATETLMIPNAQTGEYYILLVTNYSNVAQTITLTPMPGGAMLNCVYTVPDYNYLTVTPDSASICPGDSVHITGSMVLFDNFVGISSSLNPGGYTAPTPSFVIKPTASTTYTLQYSGVSWQNTLKTYSAVVRANVLPTAPHFICDAYESVICKDEYAYVYLTGGTGSYTLNGSITAGNGYIRLTPDTSTTYTVLESSSAGCITKEQVTIQVEDCTALTTSLLHQAIQLFPNPTDNGSFNIRNIFGTEISISNALGQTVYHSIASGDEITISLHNQPDGMYIVQISNPDSSRTIRLVKQ